MAKLGEHAVVLGASMAGLLAARVLADFYETVTVVERDVLPDDPGQRRGVPQARHAHALLARGSQILDELFPGLLDELVAAGAPVLDDGDLSKVYASPGHLFTRSGRVKHPRSLATYFPSRPLLDFHVRRRLRALPNVAVLDGHDVVDITSTPGRDRVTGARVVNRDGDQERSLSADLVVDALGRSARTPACLDGLGYGRPVEDHVTVHLAYASQLLRIPPGTLRERLILIGAAPGRPAGMALFGHENNTWRFTVFGMTGCEPPLDPDGMVSFAQDFAPEFVIAALRAAEPLDEPARYKVPSSQWRRYDKMSRFPAGLLVVGDAICSFNPIYGQGMTVAALDAVVLRDCLRRGQRDLAPRFFRAAAKPIGVAWQLAVGADLAMPEVEGTRTLPMRLMNRYVDRLLTAAESDAEVVERFSRVSQLIDPPTRLLHPSLLFRAATVNLRRRQDDRPKALASQVAR
jgi:2-polyprenyl-6-methoxyphenol hydroxylase-like FAD-dependent oxidoreductase